MSAPSKRSLTLDLSAPPNPSKRLRATKAAPAPVLTTPDVNMLKLSSPELAKFLVSNSMATPTPSAANVSNLFNTRATEEQELYAKGFEDALRNLHQNKTDNLVAINNDIVAAASTSGGVVVPNTTGGLVVVTSNSSLTAKSGLPASLETQTEIDTIERATSAHLVPQPPTVLSSVVVKEEDEEEEEEENHDEEESLSSSDSSEPSRRSRVVSPIDLADQERIKLERKRQRNRVAASKCRKRKLERIAQLDDRVKCLKGENAELAAVVRRLKESICNLKQEVIQHANQGCQILQQNVTSTADVSC